MTSVLTALGVVLLALSQIYLAKDIIDNQIKKSKFMYWIVILVVGLTYTETVLKIIGYLLERFS